MSKPTAPQPHLKPTFSERIRQTLSNHPYVAAMVATAGVALVGVAIFPEEPPTTEVQAAFATDGFDAELMDISGKTVRLSLDLGSCTLKGVTATASQSKTGEVDVHDYSFEAHLLSEERRRAGLPWDATRSNSTGGTITFDFETHSELMGEILGDKPCQTLATPYTEGN